MKLLHIPILNSHPCLFIERKENFPFQKFFDREKKYDEKREF